MTKIVLLMKKYTGLQKNINLIKPFYLVTIIYLFLTTVYCSDFYVLLSLSAFYVLFIVDCIITSDTIKARVKGHMLGNRAKEECDF